jgi:hypothetical protein
MSKLKELEKRLRDEPENLGLRVMLAGALHEAGRRDDAVELYRSVAIAYREQGRTQQAIAVCRSILELAPGDASCQALLAAMVASHPALIDAPPGPLPEPPTRPTPRLRRPPSPGPAGEGAAPAAPAAPAVRRSSGDVTPLPLPLPLPLPHHVADPTLPKVVRSDLPQHELDTYPEISGIASAARLISETLIAASRQRDLGEGEGEDALGDGAPLERDTWRIPRTRASERDTFAELPLELGDDDLTLPPAIRIPRAHTGDDDLTLPLVSGVPRARLLDDDQTAPRARPALARPPSVAMPTAATGPLASAFFSPVPPHSRAAVLQRFRRRVVGIGTTVIKRGETGHGLVIVVRGRLALQADRAAGAHVPPGVVGPGEYVGEVSLLARAPAAAHVVAAVDSEIMVLAASDFYEVTGAFPALWTELEAAAARRMHDQRLEG